MESSTRVEMSIPQHWFPYTKLQPPQLSNYLVERSRLSTQLHEAINHCKLTLVAAPAGSGKTSLLSILPQSDLATAWVALNATDDDLPVFVALLVSALQQQLQDKGEAILGFLQTVPYADEIIAQLASLLINNLKPFGQTKFALILDDYHTIDSPAIHQFVSYLLDYMPPSMRLVIGTRHDPPLPLPKLRMRRQLAEIRLPDLRFDGAETAVFLNQQYHLQLTESEIASLHHYTQGWAAGLQLLATVLTITQAKARSTYINQLGATNRSIFDLLATEVFSLQPPNIQQFLLQTAVLPELTPENCRAVTQNRSAAQLLESVYKRNLFLRALSTDSRRGPFRYHDLFNNFLQQQLKENAPEQWHDLHQRAAKVATNNEQKLSHLMQAKSWEEAATLLEEMGQQDTEYRYARRLVVENIESLPAPVQQNHPWLLLIVGQYYSARGQVERANPLLQQAMVSFQEQGDEMGQLEILTARAMVGTDDLDEVISAFQHKVATIGHLFRPDNWVVYHGAEIWHALMTHDWETINKHLHASLDHATQSNDSGVLTMCSLTIGPQIIFCDQGMASIENFASHSAQIAKPEDWILQIGVHSLLGFVRFFQGHVDEANQFVRESHRLLQKIGSLLWIEDHIGWLILSLALVRRAYRAFDDFVAAERNRQESQDTSGTDVYLYLQGRSFWLQGRLGESQAVLTQIQNHSLVDYYVESKVQALLLEGLLAMEAENLETAETAFLQAIPLHQRIRHTIGLTHPRLALATLYSRQKRWPKAIAELRAVIRELKKKGMPGVILQEGESIVPLLSYAVEQGVEREMLTPLLQILQPPDTPQAIPLPHSDQYLTPRESEVLRLLVTGITNSTIATELFITERTVKAHVTRILSKLEAKTRTEAAKKASQLGLI